jgi:DNA-binding NtrC family response regulator
MATTDNTAKRRGRVLVVDDNRDVLLAARLLLRSHVADVQIESDPERIPELLGSNDYDVILLDMNFTRDVTSGEEGFAWLGKILAIDPQAVVVLITAFGGVDTAVQAVKAGATDFVMKPWQNEKLVATIKAAVELRASRREVDGLRQRQRQLSADIDRSFGQLVGSSLSMKRVYSMIEKVAATDASVLVLGENGTGKELVAREIHRRSRRSDEVFVTVDLGSIPDTLFESELFGHVKGAFTDARSNRIGRFELAAGGTLFLDEIGNLPLGMQPKLLAVLENRTLMPLGSNSPRAIDVRLITATNVPIYERIARDEFRQDLLYRINTVEIRLPSLRERRDDIPKLVMQFLQSFSRKYERPVHDIEPVALEMLCRHSWPGNVRELQHVIERAVIVADDDRLRRRDFHFSTELARERGLELDEYNLERIEKAAISKAMDKHDGNVSRAARELGLTRASLYRRLRRDHD